MRATCCRHPPLTGPWSRAGFAHPGPLYYWILGGLSAVTAQASWSILVGGAVVRIVGIVATARLAWVRGGLALCLLIVAAITAAQVALEPGSLVVPWNIFAALAFFPVFLLLAWSVVLGEVRRLPWLAVVGTFLVQTHIGYGLLLLAPSVWVVVHVVRDRHGSDRAPCGARSFGASVAHAALAPGARRPAVRHRQHRRPHATTSLNTGDPKAGLARSLGWFAERFRLLPRGPGSATHRRGVRLREPASSLWLVLPAGSSASPRSRPDDAGSGRNGRSSGSRRS